MSCLTTHKLSFPGKMLKMSMEMSENQEMSVVTSDMYAYLSLPSTVLMYCRSRPVATITGVIKLNNTELDPKGKTCLSERESPYMCIDFVTCFTASYPDKYVCKTDG